MLSRYWLGSFAVAIAVAVFGASTAYANQPPVIAAADADFGTVPTATDGTASVIVRNVGTGNPDPLHVTGATITGGSWFTFDTNGSAGCLGARTCAFDTFVPPSLNVGVLCSPPVGATGSQTGTVTFTSNTDTNDPSSDPAATLTCMATPGPPKINVMTTSVAFGDVGINPSPAPTKTVTIGNDGDQDLVFTPSKVASTFSSLYTLTGCNPNCTVSTGMTATFTVTFNPTAITNPDANISINVASNDPVNGSVTIPVTGRGVAGILAISVPGGGTSINFGPVPQMTVATRTFTLTNNGNIDVPNIAAVVNPNNKGYSITSTLPPMLAANGGSAMLTVKFAPQSGSDGGPATVTFTGDSGATPPKTPAVLSLDGDGQSAGIAITNLTGMALTMLDFGNVRYNATLTSKFCVVNPNETTATLSPITIALGTGAMPGDFAVTGTKKQTTCGVAGSNVTLPASFATGDVLEVTVRVSPQSHTGAIQATLTVPTNLAATPTGTVALAANSTTGNFSLTPGSTVDFGPVDVQGAAVTKTITIKNTGDGPLDLTSFARTANARFMLTLPGNTSLGPNATLDIPVTYLPNMVRPAGSEESITLSHMVGGDFDGPVMDTITIKGRGIDRVLSPGPAPTFPDTFRNPGDQAPVRSVKLTNLGEATLKVSAAMITTNTDVWQLLDTGPVDIPFNATQEFRVRFAPKIAGSAPPATLVITHDDDMFPQRPTVSIPLNGNGIDRSVMFAPNTIQLGYTGVGVPVTVDGALVVSSTDATHTFLIRAIELDEGSPFTIEGLTPDLELAPLSQHKFSMTFTAPKEGEFSAKARLYLDMDPDATHEVTIVGTAVFIDARGGGGCAAGGAGGPAGGAVLALAALLGLRRRRARSTAGVAAAAVATAIALAPAAASADDITLSVFDPVPATTSNGFQLEAPDVGRSGDYVASAVLSYASDPLVLNALANGTFINNYAVISRSTVMDLGAAVAFLDRFEAGASLPLYAQDGQPAGDPMKGFTSQPAQGTANGDLALHAKMRLLRQHLEGDGALIAGLGAQLTLPTATHDQFIGGAGPTGRVLALGSLTPGAFEHRITLTMNLGAVLRARSTYANLEQKSGAAWGLGVQVRALDQLWGAAEVYGDTVPAGRTDEGMQSRVLSPIEWLAGVRWKPDHRFTVGLAAGRGLTDAVGTPAFRGVLSLTVTPAASEAPIHSPRSDGDADGDGIPDSLDKCPNEPEDKDMFDDTDGCPDLDNDGDGIPDAQDKCPLDPEDKDGFQDEDGCPDKDNDRDGIPDNLDKCPNEPEDKDGFADTDGCPDPDNDHDGIPDAQDKCPNQPETINGNQDDDGCPDKGDSLVVLSPDRIETLEQIQFTGGQKIAKASQNLLGQIAATLRARTEIARLRITVHVQPADEEKDQQLSDQRAAAIRDWLVQWGIAAERLEARGFGGSKPIVPADRKGSAALNNRVELIILERK